MWPRRCSVACAPADATARLTQGNEALQAQQSNLHLLPRRRRQPRAVAAALGGARVGRRRQQPLRHGGQVGAALSLAGLQQQPADCSEPGGDAIEYV
jgi:hypothetical protein